MGASGQHRTDAHMTDLPSDPNPNEGGVDAARMPLWVKVFGIIFIVLVLMVVILHLTGRGFGGHG